MTYVSRSRDSALAHRDFRLYLSARFLATIGIQMQSVAVGWQVYALTSDPLDLGYVGLVQFLPAICLALLTGHAADRFDRRLVVQITHVGLVLCSLILLGITFTAAPVRTKVAWILAALTLFGTVRAFNGPAASAMLRHLVPPEALAGAIAWSSSAWQVGTIVGPALGGLVYGVSQEASVVYGISAALLVADVVLVSLMHVRTGRSEKGATTWASLFAGLGYVFRRKIILGAISLDLFAVLLGGAVALMPAVAKDVLQVGPEALGLLRAAPAIGAAVVAIALVRFPIRRRVGALMFAGVAVFGLATIVFGVSRELWVSVAALVVLGASDMVSVNIRHTLVQMATPPSMQGRVAAVNQVFIGASNELGEFESGVTARLLGVVRAIVFGGVGTCVVVGLWVWRFRSLREVDRFEQVLTEDEPEATAGGAAGEVAR